MNTSELIERLQKLDPEGNMPVSVGNNSIHFLTTEPAYWDGKLHDIQCSSTGTPIVAKRTSRGRKLVIYSIGIWDALELNSDLIIQYETDADKDRYQESDEMERENIKKSDYGY